MGTEQNESKPETKATSFATVLIARAVRIFGVLFGLLAIGAGCSALAIGSNAEGRAQVGESPWFHLFIMVIALAVAGLSGFIAWGLFTFASRLNHGDGKGS